jgi:sensor c-di-GMP phosphodiesterase-like protein
MGDTEKTDSAKVLAAGHFGQGWLYAKRIFSNIFASFAQSPCMPCFAPSN